MSIFNIKAALAGVLAFGGVSGAIATIKTVDLNTANNNLAKVEQQLITLKDNDGKYKKIIAALEENGDAKIKKIIADGKESINKLKSEHANKLADVNEINNTIAVEVEAEIKEEVTNSINEILDEYAETSTPQELEEKVETTNKLIGETHDISDKLVKASQDIKPVDEEYVRQKLDKFKDTDTDTAK